MRKVCLCFVAVVCCVMFFSGFVQAQTIDIKNGPFVENDTTFLRKIYYHGPNPEDNHTHSLYIEKDRNSAAYQDFLNLSYDAEFQIPEFLSLVDTIYRKHGPLSTTLPKGLDGIYLRLYKYKGKYYLYTSCEGRDWRQITCPFLICKYAGDTLPYGIMRMEQTSSSTYHLSVDDCLDNMYSVKALDVYVIDEEKGVYVWKEQRKSGETYYDLYVEKSKAGAFDLLNWQVTELEDDFNEFEPIDYEEIIRQKKLF